MNETMLALMDLVSDGDFATRVTTDARQITVGEMLEAAQLSEGGVSA